jgi:hypothetical protein
MVSIIIDVDAEKIEFGRDVHLIENPHDIFPGDKGTPELNRVL